MWLLSSLVLDWGQYKAGHPQCHDSGAATATLREKPGSADRKMRSRKARSVT